MPDSSLPATNIQFNQFIYSKKIGSHCDESKTVTMQFSCCHSSSVLQGVARHYLWCYRGHQVWTFTQEVHVQTNPQLAEIVAERRREEVDIQEEMLSVATKYNITPMGVLAPGSAHARPSAQPGARVCNSPQRSPPPIRRHKWL